VPQENVSESVEDIEPAITPIEEMPILKCPKCNGELILRTAKRGENKGNSFYGCSNYPKCKYIQEYHQ
jgi:ssDNA-binding Zn-finger/Zn-ribbon topoisomerase 1